MRLPDSDEKTLYIDCSITTSLSEMIEMIQNHFGVETVRFDEFNISAEHIQVYSIGYDQYDRSDYENYIVITRKDI